MSVLKRHSYYLLHWKYARSKEKLCTFKANTYGYMYLFLLCVGKLYIFLFLASSLLQSFSKDYLSNIQLVINL